MKYSWSNWVYGKEPFEKSLERLSRFGYDAVEIKGEPDEYEATKVSELLKSYGLKASSIAGIYPWPTEERDLSNPDEKIRERAVDYIHRCAKFANEVGIPLVVVVPSPVAKLTPLVEREKEWKFSVDSVKKAGELAANLGVMLAVEPINRYETYLVNNVDQALEFATEVGLNNVRIMLDCFHMNIEEADPAASIRKAGKSLIHLHIADSNRKAVGRGHTDFQGIMRSLEEIKFDGHITMEPLPPLPDPYIALKGTIPSEILDRNTEECIDYLRRIERALG